MSAGWDAVDTDLAVPWETASGSDSSIAKKYHICREGRDSASKDGSPHAWLKFARMAGKSAGGHV